MNTPPKTYQAIPEILQTTTHRPYPLPTAPWVMVQTWYNLLFAHWPIPTAELQALIPANLVLDTFDGWGWIGVVPFGMQNVHLRSLPPVPFTHTFLELNVRTYIKRDDKPGVYFFSLDAANPLAVAVARWWFHLPYFYARMHLTQTDQTINYSSQRSHRGAPPARFQGSYAPTSAPFMAQPGSLEHWFTERYSLYSLDRRGNIYRGDIHHVPWPLQQAEASLQQNTMAQVHSIRLPNQAPLLHYAHYLKVLIWSLQRLH